MIGQKALLNGIDLLEEQRRARFSLCIGSCIIDIIVIITPILIIVSISRQIPSNLCIGSNIIAIP
jgi:hypothetical protein